MTRSRRLLTALGLFGAMLAVLGATLIYCRARGGWNIPGFSPATFVPEWEPFPEEFSLFVFMQAKLFPSTYDQPGIGRPDDELDLYQALPDGAVVVTSPPQENKALAAFFRAAHARSARGEAEVQPVGGLSVLTTGPEDWTVGFAAVHRLVCRGRQLELEVHCTLARGDAANRSRWMWGRPLVLVPLLLPAAGTYQLEVRWRNIPKEPDRQRAPAAPPRAALRIHRAGRGGLRSGHSLRRRGVSEPHRAARHHPRDRRHHRAAHGAARDQPH
jgi:hypothetical protein